jgi:NAD(P)-dependent dehydrogenase (short-subunit alcohol dehydrogenase family)
VRGRGAEALTAVGDVTSQADVAALAEQVRRQFGGASVLVNNAGIALLAPAEETTPEQWRRVLEVNLTGPFLLCQQFGAMMLGAGSGSIVNVASIAGLRGIADRAAYNASKHGLVGLTRTLAAEWGGRGVRVNAVCPGWEVVPLAVELRWRSEVIRRHPPWLVGHWWRSSGRGWPAGRAGAGGR